MTLMGGGAFDVWGRRGPRVQHDIAGAARSIAELEKLSDAITAVHRRLYNEASLESRYTYIDTTRYTPPGLAKLFTYLSPPPPDGVGSGSGPRRYNTDYGFKWDTYTGAYHHRGFELLIHTYTLMDRPRWRKNGSVYTVVDVPRIKARGTGASSSGGAFAELFERYYDWVVRRVDKDNGLSLDIRRYMSDGDYSYMGWHVFSMTEVEEVLPGITVDVILWAYRLHEVERIFAEAKRRLCEDG